MFQCINGTAPGYSTCNLTCDEWSMYLTENTHTWQHILTSHPRYPTFFYQRPHIRCRGCLCLEQLPQDIRSATLLAVFRRQLKTHLFNNAYNG